MLNSIIIRKKELLNLVTVGAFIICVVLMGHRVPLSVEMTDEAWHITDIYLVATGYTPYTDLWHQAPGMTIPVALLFRAFLQITGGTEGIVLFSRTIYFLWSIAIEIITWKLVKKIPLVFYLPFLVIPSFDFNIHYNSVGVFYGFLFTMILFITDSHEEDKQEMMVGMVAGLAAARSFIGTPMTIALLAGSILFLIIQKKKSRLCGFVTGFAVAGIVVVIYAILKGGGIFLFISGLKNMMSDAAYLKYPRYGYFTDQVLPQIKPLLVCTTILAIVRILVRDKHHSERYEKTVTFILTGSFIYGLIAGFVADFNYMICCCFYQGILVYIFLNRKKDYIGILAVSVSHTMWYILASVTAINGSSGRQYIMMASVVMSMWALYRLFLDNRVPELSVYVMALMVVTLSLKTNYTVVYRDETIDFLDTKVETGIWKGCYTTESRALEVQDMEEKVRDVVASDEKVMFLDNWVAFAYMMSDAVPCTPTSLEIDYSYYTEQYRYSTNTPELKYDWFIQKKEIPDKIIYINYGLVADFSFENPNWKFNEFLNRYYYEKSKDSYYGYKMAVYELAENVDKDEVMNHLKKY